MCVIVGIPHDVRLCRGVTSSRKRREENSLTSDGASGWMLERRSTKSHPAFFYTECVCNAWFSLELCIRFIVAPSRLQFIRTPDNDFWAMEVAVHLGMLRRMTSSRYNIMCDIRFIITSSELQVSVSHSVDLSSELQMLQGIQGCQEVWRHHGDAVRDAQYNIRFTMTSSELQSTSSTLSLPLLSTLTSSWRSCSVITTSWSSSGTSNISKQYKYF